MALNPAAAQRPYRRETPGLRAGIRRGRAGFRPPQRPRSGGCQSPDVSAIVREPSVPQRGVRRGAHFLVRTAAPDAPLAYDLRPEAHDRANNCKARARRGCPVDFRCHRRRRDAAELASAAEFVRAAGTLRRPRLRLADRATGRGSVCGQPSIARVEEAARCKSDAPAPVARVACQRDCRAPFSGSVVPRAQADRRPRTPARPSGRRDDRRQLRRLRRFIATARRSS